MTTCSPGISDPAAIGSRATTTLSSGCSRIDGRRPVTGVSMSLLLSRLRTELFERRFREPTASAGLRVGEVPPEALGGRRVLWHTVGSVPANVNFSGGFAPANPL